MSMGVRVCSYQRAKKVYSKPEMRGYCYGIHRLDPLWGGFVQVITSERRDETIYVKSDDGTMYCIPVDFLRCKTAREEIRNEQKRENA